MSADPGGMIDAINRFAYCSSNPLVFRDLGGFRKETFLETLVRWQDAGALAGLAPSGLHVPFVEPIEQYKYLQAGVDPSSQPLPYATPTTPTSPFEPAPPPQLPIPTKTPRTSPTGGTGAGKYLAMAGPWIWATGQILSSTDTSFEPNPVTGKASATAQEAGYIKGLSPEVITYLSTLWQNHDAVDELIDSGEFAPMPVPDDQVAECYTVPFKPQRGGRQNLMTGISHWIASNLYRPGPQKQDSDLYRGKKGEGAFLRSYDAQRGATLYEVKAWRFGSYSPAFQQLVLSRLARDVSSQQRIAESCGFTFEFVVGTKSLFDAVDADERFDSTPLSPYDWSDKRTGKGYGDY